MNFYNIKSFIRYLLKPKCLKEELIILRWVRSRHDKSIYYTTCDDVFYGVHNRVYITDIYNKRVIGSCEINRKTGEILDVCIREEYRRQGYGTKLIKHVLNYYDGKYLKVLHENIPAINMYEKIGFRVTKTDGSMDNMTYYT